MTCLREQVQPVQRVTRRLSRLVQQLAGHLDLGKCGFTLLFEFAYSCRVLCGNRTDRQHEYDEPEVSHLTFYYYSTI